MMTTISISTLPVPRLELLWSKEERQDAWARNVCEYGLVMPLQKNDIRREFWKTDDIASKRHDAFYVFSTTKVTQGCGRSPYDPSAEEADTPFRDGAHLRWIQKFSTICPFMLLVTAEPQKLSQ